MSLWARYLQEKTEDRIIEHEYGFATYRYPDPKTVYLLDIYVVPEKRRTKVAETLTDEIIAEAKKRGCTRLLGSVVPSSKNSTHGLWVLLNYGFKLDSSTNDFLLLTKEI